MAPATNTTYPPSPSRATPSPPNASESIVSSSSSPRWGRTNAVAVESASRGSVGVLSFIVEFVRERIYVGRGRKYHRAPSLQRGDTSRAPLGSPVAPASSYRARARARRRGRPHQQLQERLLRVPAILGLVPDPLAGAVEELGGDLLAGVRGEIVHRKRAGGGEVEQRIVEEVAGERGAALLGSGLITHAHPYVGVDGARPRNGLARVEVEGQRARGGSARERKVLL